MTGVRKSNCSKQVLIAWFEPLWPETLDQRYRRIIQQPAIDKVFILANEDGIVCASVVPDHWIIGALQTDVEDVDTLVAVARDPRRQRGWKLSVNQENQDCRTAWS